ncbi:MAG: NUDIX domain-containing protein [Candidatus Competibacteraceae bacterium]|nr:NUDIX domain-containing protein [Candidatus Competibacteraceae bacterium]
MPLPDQGLPEAVFLMASRLTPMVNVDLLIRNAQRQMLLTWRADPIFGQGWHVPGGVVRLQESFADRIAAVAANELGVMVAFQPQPIGVYETVDISRPFRTHHVSLLFACALGGEPKVARRHPGEPPLSGEWDWHSSCPEAFLQPPYRAFFTAVGEQLERRSRWAIAKTT